MPQLESIRREHTASILLLEEYDALAAAISSALRKFAPTHERRVVGKLRDALIAADELQPPLLVIDLDPPQDGLVEFFERLKSAHPRMRVLAIGCGTSPEFNAARGGHGGLHFIEKPFELPEFGQLVKSLLAANQARGLDALDLLDLIALECVSGRDTALRIEAAANRNGELHFHNGHLVHAHAGKRRGISALEEILRWRHRHFAEMERPRESPRTIDVPWGPLLSEFAMRDEPAPVPARVPEPQAAPAETKFTEQPAVSEPAKTIVVIDDTELLLDFVEEILSAAHADWRIVTAHTGTEGVRRAELLVPDLVLLDFSLPDINGDEVCRRLLANETTARIPIVMMSGHVGEMNRTAREYANVRDKIAKPFRSEEFLPVVEAAIAAGPREIAPAALEKKEPAPIAPVDGNGSKKRSRNGKKAAEPKIVAPPAPPPAPIPVEPSPLPTIAETTPLSPIALAPPPVRTAPIARAATASVPVATHTVVLLGMVLEVVAVQLTETLRIGRIRARTASRTVSLGFPPESAALAVHTGFDIEQVLTDAKRNIQSVRLIPNHQPPSFINIGRRFAVEDVEITPAAASLELTPNATGSMLVQMLAAFQLEGVEVSNTFQLARLLLRCSNRKVRLSVDPASTVNGAIFQMGELQLDASNQISELVLTPT